MKVLVYGSKGWIGSQFINILKNNNIQFYNGNSRIDNIDDLINEITSIIPTHIISFIGRTHGKIGNKNYTTIDYLEQKGKLNDNIRDNLFSPVTLAILCKKYNIHYTYPEQDVFLNLMRIILLKEINGFTEESLPNFGSGYSTVKVILID